MTARRAVYGRSTAAVVGDASHSRTLRRSPRLLHLHPIHTAHRTRRQNCRACVAWPGRIGQQGAEVCRYNSHSAGSLGFPLQCSNINTFFEKIHTEAILSNRTRKLLWFAITERRIILPISDLLFATWAASEWRLCCHRQGTNGCIES